ncbi:response regulator [Vallicoccus soli]|uniref:Response regulator n=1 Tax=Vallicoccus soli TaxID=2339232 RepID=A0A3A3ZMZ8_9ACTN|nr:response regulator [Vallicoccus soli]RJK98141.1 response regulator [Vallicoccus soli]
MTTVLVADDDADIRELVGFKLTQAGYHVVAVEDGVAALAAAREQAPDLVVLDHMMPGLTGLEVCAALRAEDATADLPIIMLTAKAQEADVAHGFATGVDDYVVKPFSPRELVGRVQSVLSRVRP